MSARSRLRGFAAALGFVLVAVSASSAADDPSFSPLAPDIAVPKDPVAKAAFDVLEKHCSRCHQAGMLQYSLERPKKGFGDVLKLDEISANSNYIFPGNPEASNLFKKVAGGAMPDDLSSPEDYLPPRDLPKVTKEDVEALRAWILSLGNNEAAACAGRTFVGNADIVKFITDDINKQQKERVRGMRYLTLSNLYNACEPEESLKVYRQGVLKLLNSLSRRAMVVKLITIDPGQTIIAFNIDDLGWKANDWNAVLSVYTYATKPDVEGYNYIAEATGAALPYVRADWFTNYASRPPLYDRLLLLPDTFGALTQELGVDIARDINDDLVARAGFQKSGVSRNNRLIERHTSLTDYLWTSYDFSSSKDEQSLFLHPLGPGGPNGFRHAGGESIFTLPNGFQGYYLNKSDGTRLDTGPTNIVQDPSQRELAVINGLSCMGCHDAGIKKAKDDIRPFIENDHGVDLAVRDAVKALYPERAKMDEVLNGDLRHFAAAMASAGLDVSLKLNGVEMVNSLAKRYEEDLSLRRAAAEFGYMPEKLKENLSQAGDEGLQLYRRLEQGNVPRDSFESEFRRLIEHSTDEQLINVAALDYSAAGQKPLYNAPSPTLATGKLQLALYSDKTRYNADDRVALTVQSTKDCYLTLIDINQKGAATVLLPNDFQRDSRIRAGVPTGFPGANAGFAFQVAPSDKGPERVLAVCDVTQQNPLSIIHDFASSKFTEIPNFVNRTLVVAPTPHADSGERAQTAITFVVQ
jgi:hypothetical protein